MIATVARSGSSRAAERSGTMPRAGAVPSVDAAERDRPQRPDAAPTSREALAHHRVDVLGARHAVLDEPRALAHERELQPVPHEARHVSPHDDGQLAERDERLPREADRLGGGSLSGDHLDGGHQQRRIQVVRADRALGRADRLADRGDRERRGVRRDDRLRRLCSAARSTDAFSSRSSGSDSTSRSASLRRLARGGVPWKCVPAAARTSSAVESP